MYDPSQLIEECVLDNCNKPCCPNRIYCEHHKHLCEYYARHGNTLEHCTNTIMNACETRCAKHFGETNR